MFTNENELVENLITYLEKKYKTKYIVRELQSGNNIADVVFTTKLDREYILFDDYTNSYYYFKNIYEKYKINIDNLSIDNKKSKKKFIQFLDSLESNGYIKIDGNNINVIKKVDVATKNLIAIEAKLSDWRAGLEQAYRYKMYSNMVYVAVEEEHIKNVDLNLFVDSNIGLISVSKKKTKEIFKPKKEKVQNLDIQYYVTDKFLKKVICT